MNIKTIKILCFLLMFISLASMFGCTNNEINYDDYIQVIYELEGGAYKNSLNPIKQLYKKLPDSSSTLIFDPTTLSNQPLTFEKHVFDGWYKNRDEIDGKVIYSNKWDFESDAVDNDGVTLYAKWNSIYKYTFKLCYKDDANKLQELGIYQVEDGEAFSDYRSLASKRYGYTPTGNFFTQDGTLIEGEYKHPGGEADLEIVIVAEYIKGSYKICRTKSDLKSARSSNIYLANDIDMEGEELNFKNFNKIFNGNGHKVSNFKISYDPGRSGLQADLSDENKQSLYISLFGNTSNAVIKDVTFENVSVEVDTTFSLTYKIYVSAIATNMKNTTIENVSFTGSFSYVKLPSGFNVNENLIYETNDGYLEKDEASTINNLNINITIKENSNE